MIMEYCELLHQNSLSLLETQEWLIGMNLAITYLLTNFYIKKYGQSYCNLDVRSLHIQKYYRKSKLWISVKLVYKKKQ